MLISYFLFSFFLLPYQKQNLKVRSEKQNLTEISETTPFFSLAVLFWEINSKLYSFSILSCIDKFLATRRQKISKIRVFTHSCSRHRATLLSSGILFGQNCDAFCLHLHFSLICVFSSSREKISRYKSHAHTKCKWGVILHFFLRKKYNCLEQLNACPSWSKKGRNPCRAAEF